MGGCLCRGEIGAGTWFIRLESWLLLINGWEDLFWHYPFRLVAEKGKTLLPWVSDVAGKPTMLGNEREPRKYLTDDSKNAYCAIVDRRFKFIDGCRLAVIDGVSPVPDRDRWPVLHHGWRMDHSFSSSQRDGSVAGIS